MNFNQAEEEYIDGEDTIGLGTLGKEGSGRCATCYYTELWSLVMFTVHVSQLAASKQASFTCVLLCIAQPLPLHCRLRIQAQQQKQKLTAKSQKKFGKRLYGSAGGTATSGLSSSLAFTPVQVSINQSCCLFWFTVQTQQRAALFLVAVRLFSVFSCYAITFSDT